MRFEREVLYSDAYIQTQKKLLAKKGAEGAMKAMDTMSGQKEFIDQYLDTTKTTMMNHIGLTTPENATQAQLIDIDLMMQSYMPDREQLDKIIPQVGSKLTAGIMSEYITKPIMDKLAMTINQRSLREITTEKIPGLAEKLGLKPYATNLDTINPTQILDATKHIHIEKNTMSESYAQKLLRPEQLKTKYRN